MAIVLAVFCVYIVVGNYRQDTLFSFMVRRKTLDKHLVRISGKNEQIRNLLDKCRELRRLNAKLRHDAEQNMRIQHQHLRKLREELRGAQKEFKKIRALFRSKCVRYGAVQEDVAVLKDERDCAEAQLKKLGWVLNPQPLSTPDREEWVKEIPTSKAFTIWTQ